MKRAAKAALRAGVAVALITPGVAHADVIIGPRVAYYFDNSNLRTSSIAGGVQEEGAVIDEQLLEAVQQLFPGEVDFTGQQDGTGILADQIAIPMVGATVNFGDDRDRFTLSGLYGEGSGSLSQTQAVSRSIAVQNRVAQDFGSATADADFDYRRLDLEATWQRRTSENFAILAGLRYERLERSGEGVASLGIGVNVDQLLVDVIVEELGNGEEPPMVPLRPAIAFPISDTSRQETFSLRGGVTAFVPVNEGLTAFFNGMVHASYQPEFTIQTEIFDIDGTPNGVSTEEVANEFSLGPDFAVGAQLIVTDGVAIDLRYRANLFFPLTGGQSFNDARVNHGVNLGVSVRM